MMQSKCHAAQLLAIVLAAFALAACGGQSFTPAPNSPLSTFSHPLSFEPAQFTVPNVAGTYNGTFTEKENGHAADGTVTMTIHQSGSKISGPLDLTLNGHTADLTFTGTVSAITGGARVKFTILNPKGRDATAHGNVFGKHLNGKAYVAPSGSQPAVYITYKTVRQ